MVAELIGIKTFLNEFIAYKDLAAYIEDNQVSPRTQVIATYALCGFTNLGSLGIMLGAMVPLIPQRVADISQMVVRALIAGSLACMLTSCVAGLLYDPSRSFFDGPSSSLTTLMPNITSLTPVS
nr:solute carrier family 28 member 3-like [Lytechinus pictus]